MSSVFRANYFYDLPDELQSLIYRKLFKETLSVISDTRESLDNYNKLIVYINENHYLNYNPDADEHRAIWCIYNRRDVGDPYYKYYQYYADVATDFLRLNKLRMTAEVHTYSAIKYLEFAIYPIKDRIKKVLEEYANTLLSDANPIKAFELSNHNHKIRIVYKETYKIRCYIDIYNTILETYNFTTHVLLTYDSLYEDDDIMDLRVWFGYNSFLNGFTIREDTICPLFYL